MSQGHADQWWTILAGFLVLAFDVTIDLWIANPLTSRTDEPALNRRGNQYLGRTATLVDSISAGRGRICLDDTNWIVEGPDMERGAQVEIIETRGSILIVKPADDVATSSNP